MNKYLDSEFRFKFNVHYFKKKKFKNYNYVKVLNFLLGIRFCIFKEFFDVICSPLDSHESNHMTKGNTPSLSS